MIPTPSDARLVLDTVNNRYLCEGQWSTLHLSQLITTPDATEWPSSTPPTISGEKLTGFDSAGALALLHCMDALKKKEDTIALTGFSDKQQELMALVERNRSSFEHVDFSSEYHHEYASGPVQPHRRLDGCQDDRMGRHGGQQLR